jgi:hypothetical protein
MYYDSELLANVAGLGSLKTEKNGSEVYIKGPKCLGLYTLLSMPHTITKNRSIYNFYFNKLKAICQS